MKDVTRYIFIVFALFCFSLIIEHPYKKRIVRLESVISDLTQQIESPKFEAYDKKKQNLINALRHLNSNVDPSLEEQIIESLIVNCNTFNLPPLLLLCVMKEESNFNPLSLNKSTASGLMQVIPKFHQDKIDKHGWKQHQIFWINNNILLGVEIFRDYFDKSNNISKALQKYVGAANKKNAQKYIENIINNYLTLHVMFFMKESVETNTNQQTP